MTPVPPEDLPTGCTTGMTRPCGPSTEAGNCALGTRHCTDGVWSDCIDAVMPAPRICGAKDDKDCDGVPDDAVDDVCQCVPGTAEPCDTHPGLDGVGACRAGTRLCEASADGRSSRWGACTGSVGPAEADSCSVRGDDANCDAIPNTGCACIEGDSMPCGPSNTGICRQGTSTCVNATFSECVGAVLPSARDCRLSEDNDCDGEPDDTVDSVCTCVVGSVEACNTHPEDGVGLCRPGSRTCVAAEDGSSSAFGACTGAVAPAPRDCTSSVDNDCDGAPDETVDATCACVIGTSRACNEHPGLDGVGRCRAGQQACVAGANNASAAFGPCTGAVGPAPADSCTVVGDDSDCDGVPNGGCDCVAGQGNAACSANPAASVCSPTGTCVPCTTAPDCSLVSGRPFCSGGLCVECIGSGDCGAGSVCNATTQTCEAAPPPPETTDAGG